MQQHPALVKTTYIIVISSITSPLMRTVYIGTSGTGLLVYSMSSMVITNPCSELHTAGQTAAYSNVKWSKAGGNKLQKSIAIDFVQTCPDFELLLAASEPSDPASRRPQLLPNSTCICILWS